MKYKTNKRWQAMIIACLSAGLSVNSLCAQENWEGVVEQLVMNHETESAQWANLMEDLADLKEHPLPINSATKEQLERFPFLSAQLVENILYYLYKYGPMLSEKELMMVEGMNRQIARFITPFITFEQPDKEEDKLKWKNILKYGKQELSTRVDIPLYTRAGYQSYTPEYIEENPNKRYLGPSFYHNFRYSFRYSDHVYVGLTAEKDAGEPFFSGANKKGYDYYSPYLLVKNWGRIRALALGNYRLSYGYGLVMNTDFSLGKSSSLSTLGYKAQGIKKHSSTDEYNYFQGIAGSYRIGKRWSVDAFYSYRKMDGIVDGRFITSLKEDGYHRIPRDLEKKNLFSNQLIGSNIHYNGKQMEIGLTGVYNVFNGVLKPVDRTYNKYEPRGQDFYNFGVNYKFFWGRFTFLGETAVDKTGRIATMNLLRYSPNSNYQFVVMNRFYDVAYQSLYAKSIGEGSSVQNESGIYIGLETSALKNIKLSAYGDFFYFPFKKYRLSKNGTSGFDGLLQVSYSPSYQLDMFIRYRYKNKERDYTSEEGEKQTLPYIQQKWKYQLNYSPMNELMLKTSVDMVRNAYLSQRASIGILVAQAASVKLKGFPLQLDLNAAWFQTDDYDSRISLYEKSLLYAFSIPSFYGKGTRLALNVSYRWKENLTLQAKYGWTHYRDRNNIGTGLEQLQGSSKQDLYLQMRVKF